MTEGFPAILQYGALGLAAIVVTLWYLYIRDQQAERNTQSEYLQTLVDRMLVAYDEHIKSLREISSATICALNTIIAKADQLNERMEREHRQLAAQRRAGCDKIEAKGDG